MRFGIVGTGFIARVVAASIHRAQGAQLTAVCSRDPDRAQAFGGELEIEHRFCDLSAFLGSGSLDAVYVATPTAAKEAIALAAIEAGKHVLVDKPFVSAASTGAMISRCQSKGVGFMDATHFVHHPRTVRMKRFLSEELGGAHTVNAAFYFPFADADNIRYDPSQEPSGVVGDLGWYTARAAVEFMGVGAPSRCATQLRRDAAKGAILHADGLLEFGPDKSSTFSVGYDGGSLAMDLQIIGPKGMLTLDDFVLDGFASFAFQHDGQPSFAHRSGVARAADAPKIEVESASADQRMIEAFAARPIDPEAAARTVATQQILDAILA
ncbi:MAG: Gfo/Idh/MocA family oxidoreductase [Myxococcota bacterium]